MQKPNSEIKSNETEIVDTTKKRTRRKSAKVLELQVCCSCNLVPCRKIGGNNNNNIDHVCCIEEAARAKRRRARRDKANTAVLNRQEKEKTNKYKNSCAAGRYLRHCTFFDTRMHMTTNTRNRKPSIWTWCCVEADLPRDRRRTPDWQRYREEKKKTNERQNCRATGCYIYIEREHVSRCFNMCARISPSKLRGIWLWCHVQKLITEKKEIEPPPRSPVPILNISTADIRANFEVEDESEQPYRCSCGRAHIS